MLEYPEDVDELWVLLDAEITRGWQARPDEPRFPRNVRIMSYERSQARQMPRYLRHYSKSWSGLATLRRSPYSRSVRLGPTFTVALR